MSRQRYEWLCHPSGDWRGLSPLLTILFLLLRPAALQAESTVRERLAELPRVPAPEARDWLVEKVSRRAGLWRGETGRELVLDNGLIQRTFLLGPNMACVGFRQLSSGESILRAVLPECRLTIAGKTHDVGGLRGQPIGNFLLPVWYDSLEADADAFRFVDFETGRIEARFPWKIRPEWLSREVAWPPPGVRVTFIFEPPKGLAGGAVRGLRVRVHYALYDGLPLMAKWLTLENGSGQTLRLDSFVSEMLACVEGGSQVEDLGREPLPRLHVETDFSSLASSGSVSQRDVVHWLPDPTYRTQVNYRLQTLCLLECRPPLGPAIDLPTGESFDSFRTWILAHDDGDSLRHALSLSRMYRTIAPWVLENPLIHHVRSARSDAVRAAIDQCAEVGFELVIMTFGSGFQIENESEEYLEQIRGLADYAHERGVALGGYSLLASRSISARDDVVNPETGKPGGFARFGNSPCLESRWGQEYFRKLHSFYEKTGCDVLEHDGSYPGDACASTEHPGHRDLADSRWTQWKRVTEFYRWCRGRGIYLNVPDWYFLSGASKAAMGYRETNWSLPRDLQEIIERQNIHDGTRFKGPTMGWMFVPLTEYHGGGAAATIEPLSEHLDHYRRRLQSLLGAGVQACYRGPRLYDTEETRRVVAEEVAFFKRWRRLLESDLVPLRRADGRDWDGFLHVDPGAETPAMAVLYNPLHEEIERSIVVPLYYAGLHHRVLSESGDGVRRQLPLDRRQRARVVVKIPARGRQVMFFRPLR